MRKHTSVRALAAGALALVLGGCGLVSGSPMTDEVRPGSAAAGGAANRPLEGAQLTVTSKEFTEQIILGQIMGLVFRAAGAEVVDRTSIQGSIGAREAVRSGAADAMYEYTGTSWITYLGHAKPVTDRREQFEAVRAEDRKEGISWLEPSTLNNTYALAVNQKARKKYGLETLSDVAALSRKKPEAMTVCVENEFASRDDGLNGMVKRYGMKLRPANLHRMSGGLVYTQTAKGSPCTFGEVFTTDGRIKAMNLHVLEDDRHFFPNYDAAPEIHAATLRKHPEIAEVLAPVTRALNNEEAQKLNARVDVDGEDPHTVAEEWLVDKGLIRAD
ncbi:glycine betaine ABC transporter substrate-binding protein [Streptomyces sp. HNM0574]|uniref:glycine betaine ABC transporter substrate-binding protein n=1 Tax=Streptomyces sp. HNM0574 TaxID=2714954 RepID=UPI00146C73FA|nr:glycine betaine ABC transporter substrate-binding protein [Streptomyces sp. HNM0574]NLU66564.1 glycine betaine ABC transporter substrate-binding protein [Streptomyces sp. HNM0574]